MNIFLPLKEANQGMGGNCALKVDIWTDHQLSFSWESVILKNTEHDQSVSALVCLCGQFVYLPLSPFFLTLSFYLNELTR